MPQHTGRPPGRKSTQYKSKWTPPQTREHVAYLQSALSQPFTIADVIRATVNEFGVYRPGFNDRRFILREGQDAKARNAISKKRCQQLIHRITEEWRSYFDRELGIERNAARAITYAHAMMQTAMNGRIVTLAPGTANQKIVVQKPSVHAAVLAADHLSRLLGTYMPEKQSLRIESQDPDDIVIRDMLTSMSSDEVRDEMAALAAKYPEHIHGDE
jgi:hypothetical protein